MRKFLAVLTALFIALFAYAPSAQAASPHFKKGGEPVCQVTNNTSSTSSSTVPPAASGSSPSTSC